MNQPMKFNQSVKHSQSTKLNLPPESVVYTGKYKNTETKFQVYFYNDHGASVDVYSDKDIDTMFSEIKRREMKAWINIIGLNCIETMLALGENLSLSMLVLEDIVHVSQRSKIERHGSYLFTIVKMIYQTEATGVIHEHLSLVLKDNLVITFQENEGDVFDGIRKRLTQERSRMRARGTDYLYYALLDAIVDHQLEILYGIGNLIDTYDRQLIETEKLSINLLFELRKQIMLIRSEVAPFKDILKELYDKEDHFIKDETRVFIRDVSDHVNHVNDQVGLYQDMVTNLYDMNMNYSSNRLNHIMTILTVFSAIFIPLNFMTGFFGMNFKHFPGLDNPLAIPIFLSTAAGIAILMGIFFLRKKWY